MKTKHLMRLAGLLSTAVVLLIATSAASSPQPDSAAAASADRHQAVAAGGKRVRLGSTRYGKILQDSRGRTLYLFTRDKRKKSRCYGDCARAWPPLVTKGRPVAIRGVRQSKLGTVRRGGGKRQVTYNGHPLYYYVDEDEPNEVLCQAVTEFGGVWYVVNRAGKAIRKR